MRSLKLLIAIPAYNEETVIQYVLDAIPDNFRLMGEDCRVDVLVVNDGSSDKTAEKVIESKRKVSLVNHILNMGAGGATLTALEYAKINNYDFMTTMDADGQHKIQDVFSTLNKCVEGGYDLVVGNRLETKGQMSNLKRLGNIGISILTKIILGTSVKDSQSGLRAYSKKAIQSLRFESLGYIFCSEMLMRAKNIGLKIGENNIEAVYTDYSKSKGQSSWNVIEFIRKMLVLRIMEAF
jgi:glycosyltransferase involved in cell wall biosynthesis